MDKGRTDGILKQLREIFSSGLEEENWERLTEKIEKSFSEKRFDQLEEDLERASESLQKRADDSERALHIHQLAEYFERYAGNFARSEELYLQAIDLFQSQAVDDPFKVAPPLNNLALLLIHQRRYSEAEPLLRQLLPIVEERFGKNHIEYAICLENLAATLRHTDREREATEIRQQAVQIRQEHRTAALK